MRGNGPEKRRQGRQEPIRQRQAGVYLSQGKIRVWQMASFDGCLRMLRRAIRQSVDEDGVDAECAYGGEDGFGDHCDGMSGVVFLQV